MTGIPLMFGGLLLGLMLLSAKSINDDTSNIQSSKVHQLVSVIDNAIPSAVFNQLSLETNLVAAWSNNLQAKFLHHKKQTYWLPLSSTRQPRPRSYIELAIIMLRRYVDVNNTILSSRGMHTKSIRGAEWWVQKVGPNQDIEFHYDKDEAVASLENRMEFPALSTVTYIHDCGGPTVVFNMTTDSTGNTNNPEIPESGNFVFPKKNRHFQFR
jgi:hypothetical protein